MATDKEKASTKDGMTVSRRTKFDIVDLVGGDGPWQRRIFVVIILIFIPSAANNLSMSFLAPNLDYWCARPEETANLSIERWKSIGMPPNDKHCSRYENINISYPMLDINDSSRYSIVPCNSWEYNNTFYSATVLSQWDLVCDRKWLISLSKSAFMAGVLVSVIVCGHLADKLGRKPVIAVSCFMAVFSAITCAFSTSFSMFIVARFFLAFGMSGCDNTGFVLLMEVVGPAFRSIYGLAVNFGWCVGFVSLPAIAWVLRDWFWIQVTLTAPMIILLVIWWVLPESPRWLLAQGRVEEAQEVLHRAAKFNGKKLSDTDTKLKNVITSASEVYESGGTKGNVFDLLRTTGLRQITLNLYFIWFVNAFVYYGLSYNTNELAGDPFVNFALSGAVEFPAYFVSIFAIRYLGRRNPLAASMVIGGIACLLSYPLPEDPWWLSVSVSMIGKFCITASFGIIFIYTTELFPTVVRNLGLGSASFCARVGSILAPFNKELGTATHPVIPQIVFGILAIGSGILVLFLPETNNCSVPNTFEEAAEISRTRTRKRKLPKENQVIIMLSNDKTDASQGDD